MFVVRTHNPFTVLTGAAGLSVREAAEFLHVSEDSAKSWSSGRRNHPPGVVDELRGLVAHQEAEAARHLSLIRKGLALTPPPRWKGVYLMSSPKDDEHARRMGYPCVSAWRAMAGRVVAASPAPVEFGGKDVGLVPSEKVEELRGDQASADVRASPRGRLSP